MRQEHRAADPLPCCPRTALASNISPAAIFRYVEASHPTLLIDEAETFVTGKDEVRGILNSGHTRDTANIIRLVGEKKYEPKEFSTWSAKAICLDREAVWHTSGSRDHRADEP